MRARYYNPEIKRFINQDILTGNIGNHKSLNRYSYVQGNPVSYTDPFGLSPFSYISEPIHSVLSMAGCIPVIGNFFDGLNSVVYLMEGETAKAVLNLTSLIPGDKLGKYVVKNGKKIAATTAVTAVICQTDAGAGIKQGLNNAKNEIVEFYGLDDMNAADYVFLTLFGMQFAKGAKGGLLDIDLPTRNKSPEIELAGTGVTVKADSIDDVINKADDVAPTNANKGGVEFDGYTMHDGSTSSVGNGKQYSVMYQANTGGGRSRSSHRNNANKQFYEQMMNNPEFKGNVDDFFGYDVMEHMKTGKSSLKNPSPDWVWHHSAENPNVIQLIPKKQHQASELQSILHPGPNGEGGFGLYY